MRLFSCLMYHQTTSPALTKYYVPINDFYNQMNYLVEQNIECIDLDENYSCNGKNSNTLLTFDDGHKSNLEAAKVMSKLGLKGYFYVVKDFSLKDPEYLSEEDVFQISEMGHFIAVHGKDHGHWTLKSDNQLEDELLDTKQWIEKITSKEVNSCAAPDGVIDERVVNCLKLRMSEFKYVRTVKVGLNQQSDYFIKIAPMHTNNSIQTFIKKVKGEYIYYSYLQGLYHAKAFLRPVYNIIKK